jgi:protein-disulfide isomerase
MRIRRLLIAVTTFMLLGCGAPSAQSPKETEALRKEIEALKASQAQMQKSLEEVRDFLKAATGGRFGGPSIVGASVEITGAPANGPATASVTLVEISDYHCPFCRRHFQQTQPRLYSEYVNPGKVRHVFLHYPIEQLHPDAYRSHEAALCAGEQQKFWQLHSKLFETPLRTIEQLVPVGESVGIDGAALRACLESGRHAQEVKDSVERIRKLGINGTPAFLIGRTPAPGTSFKAVKFVEGAQPYDVFKTAIEEVLAAK